MQRTKQRRVSNDWPFLLAEIKERRAEKITHPKIEEHEFAT